MLEKTKVQVKPRLVETFPLIKLMINTNPCIWLLNIDGCASVKPLIAQVVRFGPDRINSPYRDLDELEGVDVETKHVIVEVDARFPVVVVERREKYP